MTLWHNRIPDPQVMVDPQGGEPDRLAGKSDLDSVDARATAQRRLALKLAASAGLSVALAEVLVLLALDDGRRS